MSDIDYSELIVSKKGVITSQRQVVGNIIGEKADSIIVEKDGMFERVFVIPKSKIQGYDGAQIILNAELDELKSFEEGRDKHEDSITDTISEKMDQVKDKMEDVKDKVVDTTKDTTDKVKNKVS